MADTKQFQKDVVSKLDSIFDAKGYHEHVKPSWYAFRSYGRRVYAPIPDIAVGPFAVEEGQNFTEKYDQMVKSFNNLIDNWVLLFKNHRINYLRDYWHTNDSSGSHTDFLSPGCSNPNARCFIAIEIENSTTTRKHQMGSLINAAALGRVGIFIAMEDSVLKSAIRMREYFKLLKQYGKPSFAMDNVIVLTKDQIIET